MTKDTIFNILSCLGTLCAMGYMTYWGFHNGYEKGYTEGYNSALDTVCCILENCDSTKTTAISISGKDTVRYYLNVRGSSK